MRRKARVLEPVLALLLAFGVCGCELILTFDRDEIRDATVRPDGDVIGTDGGAADATAD